MLQVNATDLWFYWAFPAGPLRRIPVAELWDEHLNDAALAWGIETVAEIPSIGGTAIESLDNLYFADCEARRISVLTPDRRLLTLVQDERLLSPGAIWIDMQRRLLMPTAQTERLPKHGGGRNRLQPPFLVLAIQLWPRSRATGWAIRYICPGKRLLFGAPELSPSTNHSQGIVSVITSTPHRRHLLFAGLSLAAGGALGGCTANSTAPVATSPAARHRPRRLLQGATVLTLVPAQAAPRPVQADVLVQDGRIAAVGTSLDAGGAERIDLRGQVLMPGFVDTHWHMWNTIARGMGSSALGGFTKTMPALSRVWTPEASALSVQLACAEALDAGITTVHNWAHNIKGPEFAAAELAALRASGLRARHAYGYPQAVTQDKVMDLTGVQLMLSREFGPAGAARAGELVSLGLCLRGPDRSAGNVWREEMRAARAMGLPVTLHAASDREAAARGNIAVMHREGFLGPDVQLVHATHAQAADFARLRETGSPLSISPWTELEVGYGLPALQAMTDSGVEMGLSVDNMLLAGQADMFSVMRLTMDLAAGQGERQNAITHAQALRWATLGGACGLGLGTVTGSIMPGKRADLIAVDRTALNTRPVRDELFLLTHSARPTDVSLVMVDGVLHKQAGRLLHIDIAALQAQAEDTITRLRAQAGV